MRRSFGSLFLICATLLFVMAPLGAAADAFSISQQITVTATVAPARSVIVNSRGLLTMIYSNTSQAVAPVLHQGNLAGPIMAMTPALQAQYAAALARASNTVGLIAVPHNQPSPTLGHDLTAVVSTISTLLTPASRRL